MKVTLLQEKDTFNQVKNTSTSMDLVNRNFCLELAKANSEKDLINILKKHGYWDNESSWTNFGNIENNFSTIGNQQDSADTAIVEKLINSVDAVLTAKCLDLGINPQDEISTPKSVHEALIKFFDIKEGKIVNLTASERTDLSENIALVATGSKSNPCYSIIDKGEGQTPMEMPNTFLSVSKSNKIKIPFVQGKFHMGGTGVLPFCGEHNLQLIITKRKPTIANIWNKNDDTKNKWGFTIIRRFRPSGNMKCSTYKYLSINNQIPCFEANYLPLLPTEYPNAIGRKLEYGTFIKLYDYDLAKYKTNVTLDFNYRLSLLLPDLALPIRLYERRSGYSAHTYEKTLSGYNVRIDTVRNDNLEEGFPVSGKLEGDIPIQIIAFKKDKQDKYIGNEGVIFTINGQTHGNINKSFFTRKSVKLDYIANSIIAIVDCTNIETQIREDLFLNSRDRLRKNEDYKKLEESLEYFFGNHPGLKALNAERRNNQIKEKLGDAKPLAEFLNNMLEKSPSLSKLFIEGHRLSSPLNLTNADTKEEFHGKKYPTYFNLSKNYSKNSPKETPINHRARILFETDAANDYFNREIDPGTFLLKINGQDFKDYQINLWNGHAILNVSLIDNFNIGEIIKIETIVADKSRVDAFTNEFFIKILEIQSEINGKPGHRKDPASEKEGDSNKNKSKLSLPNIFEIESKDWDTWGFDKETALMVKRSGENEKDNYDFFINLDNVYLLREKSSKPQDDPKIIEAQYKYSMVIIGLALLNDNKSDFQEISNNIAFVTKQLSPFVIPMIMSLSKEIE